MYKKLLLNSLAALGLLTTPLNQAAIASAIESNPHKNQCSAKTLKNSSKLNLLEDFNFSTYLKFQVAGSQIVAKFLPQNQQNQPLELDTLAAATGYKSFNWVSYVEQDPYGIADYQGKALSLPYNDPPLGGYQYDKADDHPFYWDIEQCHNCHSRYYYHHPQVKQKFALTFEDSPSDHRLKPGETIEFVTHLVGVRPNLGDRNSPHQWDVLSTFTWQLTNNAAGHGQVALTAVDLNVSQLSPSVLNLIQKDGGRVATATLAHQYHKNSFHSLQCRQQNHQNQHLDTHL